MDTVYERCGGDEGIKKVVSVFYDLVLESPRLSRYFDNTNMEELQDHQSKFISWVTEGPVHFSDDSLREAHEGLGITHSEFLEVVGLLYDALERNDIAAADIDHVIRAFLRREPLIVFDDDDIGEESLTG